MTSDIQLANNNLNDKALHKDFIPEQKCHKIESHGQFKHVKNTSWEPLPVVIDQQE